jgi:hypothetical protein
LLQVVFVAAVSSDAGPYRLMSAWKQIVLMLVGAQLYQIPVTAVLAVWVAWRLRR